MRGHRIDVPVSCESPTAGHVQHLGNVVSSGHHLPLPVAPNICRVSSLGWTGQSVDDVGVKRTYSGEMEPEEPSWFETGGVALLKEKESEPPKQVKVS